MISANTVLYGSYDYSEVARSVFIAIAASYAALDLTGRVTPARGRVRQIWLSGGAVALGIGIWATHFKGMMAFRLPVSVAYDWLTILAALLVAIFASAVALSLASGREMGRVEAVTGSMFMGSGIAGLHYLLMAAMRLPAITKYSPVLVTSSILLAILFSLIALLLAFGLREETRWSVPRRLGSAVVMGAAVSAMHYTGMAAASFFPGPPADLSHTVNVSPLANNGIAIVTLMVLVAAMTTSSVDRRASAEVQRLNEDLERRVTERTFELEAVNQELRKEIVERERAQEGVRRSKDRLRLLLDLSNTFVSKLSLRDFFDVLAESLREIEGWAYTFVALPESAAHLKIHLVGGSTGELKAGTIVPIEGTIAGDVYRSGQFQFFRLADLPPVPHYSELTSWREFARAQGLRVGCNLPLRYGGKVLGVLGFHTRNDMERAKEDLEFLQELAKLVALALHNALLYGELNESHDALRESEDRLRLVIDTLPTLAWSKLPDGSADFLNQRFREYTGLSVEEGLGWGWMRKAFHPEDRAEDEWRAAFAAGQPFEKEARMRRADGEYRWFLHRAVPLRDELGNVVKWYGTTTDVEERKRTEAALQEARDKLAHVTRTQAMGELAAAIAHEVNQPLTAIVTNGNFSLRSLESATPNTDELREAITEIVNDGTRASAVISRIRGLLTKGTFKRTELDINQIIHEVTILLRSELTRNRVHLSTELMANLPRVQGDPVQLQQVLINLVMNAVEAMQLSTEQSRRLLIRSARNPEGILVQVQDSGPGIQPQQVVRIFEPFFTTKAEGIGMGLSISRSIVESHGGHLSLLRTSQGAVFQFTLPIDPNDAS